MKEKFNQMIAGIVKPLLKEEGFSKNGMNFYRKKEDLIFLFNFQNSQGNSAQETKFYINCGIHSTNIDRVIGKTTGLDPKESECYFRKRISSIVESTNDGYVITQETDLNTLGLKLDEDLKAAIAMFNNITSTNDLIDLMIEKNGLNNYRELFKYLLLTERKTQLKQFVKQLHRTFGAEKRWAIFENNLTEVLKDNNSKETIAAILNDD
ncbi:protein of unknown function [Pedobacter caeni]|uniref:DUF4304 domain-containing protein n=2 Tax=Pedobacter caeni TaxID=288992 RepID=A0A1M4WDK8_9SPHI|nr:protein of unknown function [Pedobacter caeni]